VGAVNGAASDNPLALGLIIVGAVALAISTFLPLVEPTGTFRTVEHNTLIQRGGWMVIALAFGIAASGYRVSQGRWTARWIPIALHSLPSRPQWESHHHRARDYREPWHRHLRCGDTAPSFRRAAISHTRLKASAAQPDWDQARRLTL
jgi:hypothetical protein